MFHEGSRGCIYWPPQYSIHVLISEFVLCIFVTASQSYSRADINNSSGAINKLQMHCYDVINKLQMHCYDVNMALVKSTC